MPGDIDGSGTVTTDDARMVLQAALGKISLTEIQEIAADVYMDYTVTTDDARLILQYALGKIARFYIEDTIDLMTPEQFFLNIELLDAFLENFGSLLYSERALELREKYDNIKMLTTVDTPKTTLYVYFRMMDDIWYKLPDELGISIGRVADISFFLSMELSFRRNIRYTVETGIYEKEFTDELFESAFAFIHEHKIIFFDLTISDDELPRYYDEFMNDIYTVRISSFMWSAGLRMSFLPAMIEDLYNSGKDEVYINEWLVSVLEALGNLEKLIVNMDATDEQLQNASYALSDKLFFID
jgi:hypothetical protein